MADDSCGPDPNGTTWLQFGSDPPGATGHNTGASTAGKGDKARMTPPMRLPKPIVRPDSALSWVLSWVLPTPEVR